MAAKINLPSTCHKNFSAQSDSALFCASDNTRPELEVDIPNIEKIIPTLLQRSEWKLEAHPSTIRSTWLHTLYSVSVLVGHLWEAITWTFYLSSYL